MIDAQRGGRSDRSFEHLVVIPIDDLLAQLDMFMTEAAHVVATSKLGKDWSALQDLGLEAQTLAQELNSRGLL